MELFRDLPERWRITVAGRSLDAGGLLATADGVAARIHGAGVVAVDATSTLETVVSIVGALRAGVVVVPVPADAGPIERDHILRDSRAAVLLRESEQVDLARSPAAAMPAGVAMVMYTSGTTGPPKGVLLTAEALAANLDALAAAWEWTAEDTLVHGLPLYHVHGLVLGVLGAMRVGSALMHTGRPTPAAYAEAGGSLYFGVPTIWSRIARDPAAGRALRGARLLVSGSAGLPAPVFESLAELAGQGPVERYGMTESLITISGTARGDRRPGWVGRPLAGVETRLVDSAGVDDPGELEVRAPWCTAGYLGLASETAALIGPEGWLRTGDVACVDDDGWHRIVGRKSTDLIKSGGYRIGAGEVEAALLAHPAVSEAAVVGVPDEDLGQRIVAYVVADGVTGPELIDFVAQGLSAHKRPRHVELVDGLPRNAMGKVQKSRLVDLES